MTLELTQIMTQIEQAVRNLTDSSREYAKKLETAHQVIREHAAHLDQLREKLKAAKTTWLVAGLTGGLSQSYPLPSLPADFSVLGVDGSNIDLDRHSTLSCYLLNMGMAHLTYGSSPQAHLESFARLYSAPEDLVMKDPGGSNQEQRVDSVILGIKRSVEECALAGRTLQASPPNIPTLALFDGTLILWGLATQSFPDFIIEIFLKKGFLHHLDKLRQVSRQSPVPVASYISYPGGAEVVNILRVAVCPFSPPDCDRCCTGPKAPKDRPCAVVAGITDRALFENILKSGERSDLFMSLSSIVNRHYADQKIHFFYLNTGEEIARVEIPQWVAENGPMLNFAHAAIYDQCQRGRGYPIALQEAHEKAVVTVGDRQAFRNMISRELLQNQLERDTSLKNQSKRVRWL